MMASSQERIWNDYIGKRLLLIAMSLTLLTHGVIFYFTLPGTYDAYVHIFFADHYSRFWFEPWDPRWYTGFLTISYPPLLHQMVALLGKIFPFKVAFAIYSIFILEVLIIGVYRFTKLFYDKMVAGVAALLTLVMSSVIQTLHVYGQIPTLHGISFLLNALPFLYQYLVRGKGIYLVMAMAFLSVVVCAHHVTAIFGMLFFVAPTVFMALYDRLPPATRSRPLFFQGLGLIREAFGRYRQFFFFGAIFGILAVGLIFPYWYWSKSDPINQVSIPHGSRDNFLKKTSSGLMFFLIPLALVMSYLPAIAYALTRQKRLVGWAVSFFLCFLLGSGGTTPLPAKILGVNAFNILTLDRFGFWASIIAIPFIARFIYSFLAGSVREFWVRRFSATNHFLLSGVLGFAYFIFVIFVFHLSSFRPLQPKEIEIQPLINFLNRDDHLRWRYITLGFGDQMAWLSANSMAASVDGNYHSARRLPELTTRPVERLENAKYSGDEGLASLKDFLTRSEKYSLKYVFSNDRYYDPLLYYTGWSRVVRLENGIMVWEKGNIPTITPVEPKKLSPLLKRSWGILPVSCLCMAGILAFVYLYKYKEKDNLSTVVVPGDVYSRPVIYCSVIFPILFFTAIILYQIRELLFIPEQKDPSTTIISFYNHLDFQRFEQAFHLFRPTHTYTLDQYLLEKSVNEGGLLPSYAKLDSIGTEELERVADTASMQVYTRWRTSLGLWSQVDTLKVEKVGSRWYIRPPELQLDIAKEQVTSYQYDIFKKLGKRVISSFPAVRDDRIKKPFIQVQQAQIIQRAGCNYVTGEVLNADDVPVNLGLKVVVYYRQLFTRAYYPAFELQYNLSPKSATYFQIPLDSAREMDSLGALSVDLRIETDVSERGYVHGGTMAYTVRPIPGDSLMIRTNIYNELTTELNIPGVLFAEKDKEGTVVKVDFALTTRSIRTGLSRSFDVRIKRAGPTARIVRELPLEVLVDDKFRPLSYPSVPDPEAAANDGIVAVSHCFISSEIFLQ